MSAVNPSDDDAEYEPRYTSTENVPIVEPDSWDNRPGVKIDLIRRAEARLEGLLNEDGETGKIDNADDRHGHAVDCLVTAYMMVEVVSPQNPIDEAQQRQQRLTSTDFSASRPQTRVNSAEYWESQWRSQVRELGGVFYEDGGGDGGGAVYDSEHGVEGHVV